MANTMSAVPKAAHAWRAAVENDEPSVMMECGKSAKPHEVSGPIKQETPVARTPCSTMISQNGVDSSMNAMETAPAAKHTEPTVITGRAPMRSTKYPANGFTTNAATVPGSSESPASSAVPPHCPSTNSGSTSVIPM